MLDAVGAFPGMVRSGLHWALPPCAPRGSGLRNLRTRWRQAAPVVRVQPGLLLRARLLLVRWRGLVGRRVIGSWLALL